MGNDKKYDSLFSKYNMTVAKTRDLMGQLEKSKNQSSEMEAEKKHMEKRVRELCAAILAGDRSEMRLGKEYTWDNLTIDELITQTSKSYKKSIQERTEFQEKLLDECEERQGKIDSLNEQLEEMLLRQSQAGSKEISREELEQEIQKEKEKEEALDKAANNKKDYLKSGSVMVVTDDDELLDAEAALFDDMAETDAKLTPKPMHNSMGMTGNKRQEKINSNPTHVVELNKIMEQMDEQDWFLMQCVGENGISLVKELSSRLEDEFGVSSSKNYAKIKGMCTAGLFEQEYVKAPTGKFYSYWLSDMGRRVYKARFKKDPVKSDAEIIRSEHDNLEHGYGIVHIAELLCEKKLFQKVTDKNRKFPIKTKKGDYIPDILCLDKQGRKHYIEYEMGTHTQTDFNLKCDKMREVTKVLNFVTPNKESMGKVQTKIEKWIDRCDIKKLNGITVRIATATTIRNMDNFNPNDNWDYCVRPGAGSKTETKTGTGAEMVPVEELISEPIDTDFDWEV